MRKIACRDRADQTKNAVQVEFDGFSPGWAGKNSAEKSK
jgi:hypothetical protein